ncbi:hypothetical protein IEO21_09375 [Rhodonia placenta]|uniref:Uncharacterized protein n=1 Tax=Rhodonia placenta TaxID=104341 RepID=A0A8H7TYA5_9APHY|nr:hypothetical protein IEO21_09375 [Postia placenta]
MNDSGSISTAKPILIDLPSQSIHLGEVGQKLAAGAGRGAETLTSGRWATEDREVDARCNPLVLSSSSAMDDTSLLRRNSVYHTCLTP